MKCIRCGEKNFAHSEVLQQMWNATRHKTAIEIEEARFKADDTMTKQLQDPGVQ